MLPLATIADPRILLDLVVWGLISGAIYVLLATGLNLIFGVMQVVNFAHGELMMLGAFATHWLSTSMGINVYLAVLLAVLLVAGVGVAVQRLGFRPLRGEDKVNEVFLSMALILIFQNAHSIIFDPYVKIIDSPTSQIAFETGGIRLPANYILIVLLTAGILAAFYTILKYTTTGLAFRATTANRTAASLMGINVERVDAVTFGVGAGLAAVAGALLGIIVSFYPYSGTVPAVKGFVIIILGGLGSVPGAVVAGFLYGIAESLAVGYLGGAYRDAIAFVVVTLTLIIRPSGIFGKSA